MLIGRTLVIPSLVSAALFLALACGGKVTVEDGSGGGGSGGTGSGNSGTGNSGTGNSGNTGNTGTGGTGNTGTGGTGNVGNAPPVSTCDDFCGVLADCGATGPECSFDCQNQLNDFCGPEWQDLMDCIVEEVDEPQCDFDICIDEIDQWSICTDPGPDCGPQGCFGGPGNCGCDVECFGVVFSSACQTGPNGSANCDCFADGMFVTTCQSPPNGGFACDMFDGCCNEVFFLDGDTPPPNP